MDWSATFMAHLRLGVVEVLLDERERRSCPPRTPSVRSSAIELRHAGHGDEHHLGRDPPGNGVRVARIDEIASSCMVRNRSA